MIIEVISFFCYNGYGDNMGWFTSNKKEMSSMTMTSVVYESVRIRNSEIEPILDRTGALYDSVENQLVVMAINFEIMNWVLKKGNPENIVSPIIEASYQKFFSSLRVDENTKREYERIMNQAKVKADEILFSKFKQRVPKYILIYLLILELEDIKEAIIEPSMRKELEMLVNGWFQVAEAINNEYKIVDKPEDLEKNKPIDFDF